MPISDEIIELAPIKKSKPKMIIVFVLMGLFFAAAAAFFVLYLLKPSATVSTGAVLSVEEAPVNTSAVQGAKALFKKTEGDDSEYFATVGVEYTVAVKVSVEGEANNQVSWIVEPHGALDEKGEGSYDYGVTTVEDGRQSVHWYKFTVLPEFAGQQITITARSHSDSAQRSVIKFNAVNQGAETVEFVSVERNEAGASTTNITTEKITLPFYDSKSNSYLLVYRQLGASNGTEHNDIAHIRLPDGTYTDKVEVTSSNPATITARVVETAQRPTIEINLLKTTPDADHPVTITLKANVNNASADEVTQTLKIVSTSSKELGYIDDIRIIKEETSTTYFSELRALPASIPSITLPYGTTYNEILKHVVLSPWTLQYDAAGDKLIENWKDNIEVTSSNNNLVTTSSANRVVSITAHSTLSTDCTLTFRDKSANSTGATRQLKVNVVAQHRANGIASEVKIGTQTYNDNQVSRNELPISQGLSANVTFTYTVTAPANTSKETLGKYISSAYRLFYNKSEMTVRLGSTVIEPYNPNPAAGQKTNEQDLSGDITFKAGSSATTFVGEITFEITINEEAENGIVSFSFMKIGAEIPNADAINTVDATIEKTVNFAVTNIARRVMLKDEIPGVQRSALDIVTERYTLPGKIEEVESVLDANGITWRLTFNVYIQYGTYDATLWFKPQDLIYADGPATASAATFTPNNQGSLSLTALQGTAERELKFNNYAPNFTGNDASAKFSYTNTNSEKIAEVTINYIVINGISAITVENSNVKEVTYSGNGGGNGNANFAVDKVRYTHIYSTSQNQGAPEDPYGVRIKYGSDTAGIYFEETEDEDTGDVIFKYVSEAAAADDDDDDDGAPTSINVFRYSNGYIYLLQDLFSLGYNYGIDLSRITIEYTANPAHYPLENLKASRIYNFVRLADDIGVYTDRTYSDSSKVEKDISGNYFIEVNHNSSLSIYTSPIINVNGVGPIVYRHPSDVPVSSKLLPVEDAYLKLPDRLPILSVSMGEETSDGSGLYRYVVVVIGEASETGRKEYKNGFITLENSRESLLQIDVLNYMRGIAEDGIKIYDAETYAGLTFENGDPTGNPTTLTDIILGIFNGSTGTVVDNTSVTFYVYVKYATPADNQSEFEPAIIEIPTGFTASEGGRYNRTESLDLTPVADEESLDNAHFYKIWEITISLDKQTATDGTKLNNITVLNQGGVVNVQTRVASASLNTTVSTGLKTLVKTGEEYATIEYVFDSSDPITKEFAVVTTSLAEYAGYTGVKYDFSNLTGELETTMQGVEVSFETLRAGESYFHVQLTPSKLPKKLDGDEFFFNFTDTANGANTVFRIRILLSTRTVVYDIDLEEEEYAVTTNGKDGEYAELPITVVYNAGGVPPTSTDGVNVKLAVQTENGTFNIVESASIDNNIEIIKSDGVSATADGKSTNAYTLRVKHSMLSSGNVQYYVYAYYYDGEKTVSAYAPIKITTTALDIALSDAARDNVDNNVANLNFKTKEKTYDLSAKIINKGNSEDNAGSHTINYALYSDAQCDEPLGEGIATITGGIFKLVNPDKAFGTIYYKATFADPTSGKTRELRLTVNYTVSITEVTLDGIDSYTYNDGVITLYYVSNAAYSMLDLANRIRPITAFGDIELADYTVKFTAQNGDLINGALLEGTNYQIVPLKVGSTPFAITVKDATGTEQTLNLTIKVLSIENVVLDGTYANIDLFKNAPVTFNASVSGDAAVFAHTFELVGDSRISVEKEDRENSAEFTLKLDRTKFTADSDSDDKPYTLTLTVTYSYLPSLSVTAQTVGSFTRTAEYTLTVGKDFTGFGFELYKGDDKINDNDTIFIDHSADYKLKLSVPVNSESWYQKNDWTFKALPTPSTIASVANGGVFDKDALSLAVTPSRSAAGEVTFTFTATAYGATLTLTKSYTFAVTDNVTVTITASVNGGQANAISFSDEGTATKAIDFDSADKAAKFTYTVALNGTGTTATGCDIDYVGDATAGELSTDANGYSRTFTVTKPTTLILSSAVKINGVTIYSKKYTITITATAPDFGLKSTNNAEKMNPATALAFELEETSDGFMGDYTVAYSIVQSGTGATLQQNDGDQTKATLTAPTTNFTDKLVTVRATVSVTSGAYIGTTYTVEKTVVVVGIALPTIGWKSGSNPITVLGPSEATKGGKFINLEAYRSFNATVRDSYNQEYTYSDVEYTYTLASDTLSSSTDYALSNGNTLNITANDVTKAGGIIYVTVKAKILSGANKDSEVSAVLAVMIMPEATAGAAKFVSGQAGTYTLGELAHPANSERTDAVQQTDDYTVKYTLASSYAGKYAVFGDTFRIINSIKTVETVPLTVDMIITSGAYAGVALRTTVNVTVLGTVLNEGNTHSVSWSSSDNKYTPIDAASLVDMSKLGGWSISTITVTTDNSSFTSVQSQGTAEPSIDVNKDFNVTAGTASQATLTLYYDIALTGSASAEAVHCYGEGTIAVDSITPALTVQVDGVDSAEEPSVSLPGGQSFIISYTETHGLRLTGIEVSNIGSSLSYTVSGSSVQFTAASSVTTNQPAREVVVKLTYSARGEDVEVEKTINITVTKAVLSAFDVTNTNMEVLYLNSGNTNTYYNVYSVWTATETNNSKHPVQLEIRSSSALSNLFDNGRNAQSTIKVYMFGADGVLIGDYTYNTSQLYSASNATSITMDLHDYAESEVERMVLVMQFKRLMSTSATLTVNYYTTSDGGTSTANYTQKIYNVRRISGSTLVTFDLNGGTLNRQSSVTVSGSAGNRITAPGSSPAPVREGYRFEGWYPMTNPSKAIDKGPDGEDDSSRIVDVPDLGILMPGDSLQIVFNATYYAAWTIVPTTVTLEAGLGQVSTNGDDWGSSATIEVSFGEPYSALATVQTQRAGYSFGGWYLDTQRVSSTTTVDRSTAHTLTARWNANDVVVTFNPGEGNLDDFLRTRTIKFDSAYGELPTPTRTGYTFVQWELNGDKVESGTLCTTEDAVTLTAKWQIIAYTITLDPAYGDKPTTTVNRNYGEGYGNIAAPEARTGYTFDGWYTQPNGKGTKIVDGSGNAVNDSQNKVTGDITLYANWISNSITVTLNYGIYERDNEPETLSVTYGGTYEDLPTLTMTGYVFEGWTVTSGGTDFVYASSKVTKTESFDLYAKFTAKKFKVALIDTHGKAQVSYITVTFGGDFDGLPTLTDTGYTFKGWFDNKEGTGSVVTDETEVTTELADSYTLYAVWEIKKIKISFNKNEGTGTAEDREQVEYGSVYGPLPTLTKVGYTFDGWTKSNNGTNYVNAWDKVDSETDITLYAHFTAKQYSVMLVNVHGEQIISYITVTFGGKFVGLPATLSAEGYSFKGWYEDAAGSGTAVTDETEVTTELSDNYTLYAVWEPNPVVENTVTITFNPGDDNTILGEATLTVTVDADGTISYIDLIVPDAREGFTFEGWYTGVDGDGTKVTSATQISELGGSYTLYAKWTQVED